MEAHRVERKLSAIFAADVEGYSRLMGRDEVGTLRTLTAYRVIIDRLIASHRGRIFNTAGDSILADFVSAVPLWCLPSQVSPGVPTTNLPHRYRRCAPARARAAGREVWDRASAALSRARLTLYSLQCRHAIEPRLRCLQLGG